MGLTGYERDLLRAQERQAKALDFIGEQLARIATALEQTQVLDEHAAAWLARPEVTE